MIERVMLSFFMAKGKPVPGSLYTPTRPFSKLFALCAKNDRKSEHFWKPLPISTTAPSPQPHHDFIEQFSAFLGIFEHVEARAGGGKHNVIAWFRDRADVLDDLLKVF